MDRYETKKRSEADMETASWRGRKGEYGVWDNSKKVWLINYMFVSKRSCDQMANILNRRLEAIVEARRHKGKGSDFK